MEDEQHVYTKLVNAPPSVIYYDCSEMKPETHGLAYGPWKKKNLVAGATCWLEDVLGDFIEVMVRYGQEEELYSSEPKTFEWVNDNTEKARKKISVLIHTPGMTYKVIYADKTKLYLEDVASEYIASANEQIMPCNTDLISAENLFDILSPYISKGQNLLFTNALKRYQTFLQKENKKEARTILKLICNSIQELKELENAPSPQTGEDMNPRRDKNGYQPLLGDITSHIRKYHRILENQPNMSMMHLFLPPQRLTIPELQLITEWWNSTDTKKRQEILVKKTKYFLKPLSSVFFFMMHAFLKYVIQWPTGVVSTVCLENANIEINPSPIIQVLCEQKDLSFLNDYACLQLAIPQVHRTNCHQLTNRMRDAILIGWYIFRKCLLDMVVHRLRVVCGQITGYRQARKIRQRKKARNDRKKKKNTVISKKEKNNRSKNKLNRAQRKKTQKENQAWCLENLDKMLDDHPLDFDICGTCSINRKDTVVFPCTHFFQCIQCIEASEVCGFCGKKINRRTIIINV